MYYYQNSIIELDSIIRVRKPHYRKRLKKNPIPKNFRSRRKPLRESLFILTTFTSLAYPKSFSTNQKPRKTLDISSNSSQVDYYSKQIIKLWWNLGQKIKADRICQLTSIVNYYWIRTNWERYKRSCLYKTSPPMQKLWTMGKKSQRRLHSGRYNTANHQKKYQYSDCL